VADHFELSEYPVNQVRAGTNPIMSSTQPANSTRRAPVDFLQALLGSQVAVKLNSGIEYRGILNQLHSPGTSFVDSHILPSSGISDW
jgi:hypothetical protein